jgi:hypothetical protein
MPQPLAAPLLLSALLSGAVGDEAVGINVHEATQGRIDAVLAAGVSWIRVDANWFVMNPAPNRYEFAAMDAQVALANAAGLRVYMSLAYTPGWVPRHGDTDGSSLNDVPNGSAEWVDYVEAMVARYRPLGVRHFGIWNEANLSQFWEGSLAEWSQVIANPGSAAVRAACSDCFVLGPELASVGASDDALEAVLAATLGAWDIITHHTYQGFRETGTGIFDGDSFINILDQRRFPGTRRPIRQLLDAIGWTGEVWISETGFRADPPGDATREQTQATYVRRALEEQRARPWYTNTFFYEIEDCGPDQPGCPIDGFGVLRSIGGQAASRRFPQDYRIKPAFDAIRAFIQANPAFAAPVPPPPPPLPACGDGMDNDRDGRIDARDRGCSGDGDTDEADPPRLRLEAVRRSGVTMDGAFGEYPASTWIALGADTWTGREALGGGDLEVRAAAAWTPDALFFAVEVTDDVHHNARPAAELWRGDSVQLDFDLARDSLDAFDGRDDHELNFALDSDNGGLKAYRYHGPQNASDDFDLAVVRRGDVTRYELRVSTGALARAGGLSLGETFGFSFLVNDSDGDDRIGWKAWTRGIAEEKAPYFYGELALVMGPPEADAGVPLPPDAGQLDAGRLDAGSLDAGPRDASAIDAGGRDASVRADAAAPDASQPPSGQSDGCACDSADSGSPANALAWLAALVPLAISGRRRARSAPRDPRSRCR